MLAEDSAIRQVICLEEYKALKLEQLERIKFRDNLIVFQLGAVGAVTSWVLADSTHLDGLLVLPWIGIILGWTYLVYDHSISALGRYFREVTEPRLTRLAPAEHVDMKADANHVISTINEHLGWEPYHRLDHWRRDRKKAQLWIDRIVFVAPGLLAVIVYMYQLIYDSKLALSPRAAVVLLEIILTVWLWFNIRKRSDTDYGTPTQPKHN